MPNILTPLSLWGNFDISRELEPEVVSVATEDGITVEKIYISGSDTGEGRVRIACALAYEGETPVGETVLLMPDSKETIDLPLMKFFVKEGYTVFMVDYRGEWEGCDFYTVYPEKVSYANLLKCERRKDFVDDDADITSWYVWVGVGLYARKYIVERTGSDNIALIGLRDGGEIAWKMGVVAEFKCIIPVCAAGWKAYAGYNKFMTEEPVLDEERYRFIAGIDSQAYAPYVKCPVLMLCTTNDPYFDSDRAYDTFSRINGEFLDGSAISYSVLSSSCIDGDGTENMLMFLAKHLKNRQIYIPKPPVCTVTLDTDENLIAQVGFDGGGIVAECNVYLAEDCANPVTRDWTLCPLKNGLGDSKAEYYLNIYDKTSSVFVFCGVKYNNGFIAWSKMTVKKISGSFRNMQSKTRMVYQSGENCSSFKAWDYKNYSVAETFLVKGASEPAIVEKSKGLKGVYCSRGLTTYRFTNSRFAPSAGYSLSLDIFSESDSNMTFSLINLDNGEEYFASCDLVGKVWQNVILDRKTFKTKTGAQLQAFTQNMKFSLNCDAEYAINNILWL